MIRYSLLIGCFMGLMASAFAQKPLLDAKRHELLTNTVNFVNTQAYIMSLLQEDLAILDESLAEYWDGSVQTPLVFMAGDSNSQAARMAAFSHEMYAQSRENIPYLPEPWASQLTTDVDSMELVVRNMLKDCQELSDFIRAGGYKDEEEAFRAWVMLNEVDDAYATFLLMQQNVRRDVDSVLAYFRVDDSQQAYQKGAKDLQRVVRASRDLLIALREERLDDVQRFRTELALLIKSSRAQQELNLKGIIAKSKEAHLHYFETLKAAETLFSMIPLAPSNPLLLYEKTLPYFNRLEDGVVQHYNRFVSLAIIPYLKETDELLSYQASRDAPSLKGAAPNNLVFLLDVSSSMDGPQKLPLLKQSLRFLLKLTRPSDQIAIVTYSGKAELQLPSTSADQTESILTAIENLSSKGKTDAMKGMRLAYEVLDENWLEGGNNRIILATDGGFPIETDMEGWVDAQKGVLSVFFFGDPYSTRRGALKRLARIGKGNYAFIRAENARAMILREANGE